MLFGKRLNRPRAGRIIRPVPRKAQLLRQIAERLPIDLDLFNLVSIKRIVRHDKVIGCGNAPITLGAYASREIFYCRYGRDVCLLFRHHVRMRFCVSIDISPLRGKSVADLFGDATVLGVGDAQFTNDINLLVTGGDPDQMVFLRKLS